MHLALTGSSGEVLCDGYLPLSFPSTSPHAPESVAMHFLLTVLQQPLEPEVV